MNSPRGESEIVRHGGPSGLRRFGLYALVAVHKALLAILLLEAAFEGGFQPETEAEYTQKLAETLSPAAYRDDRPLTPNRFVTAHVDSAAGPAGVAHFDSPGSLDDPSARPSGPRAPPIS